VEHKTEVTQHVLKIQYISLLAKYIKYIFGGDFTCVHIHKCRSVQG